MTCPRCRERGDDVEIEFVDTTPRGTEVVIVVRCPECHWQGRFDTG